MTDISKVSQTFSSCLEAELRGEDTERMQRDLEYLFTEKIRMEESGEMARFFQDKAKRYLRHKESTDEAKKEIRDFCREMDDYMAT